MTARRAARIPEHVGAFAGHYAGRLANGCRLKADGELEPAQFPIVVRRHQNVARRHIPMDELADGMQIMQGLQYLHIDFLCC